MAVRPAFYMEGNKIFRKDVEFEWAGGFAVSQKKKNVMRMQEALGGTTLEVSTKSDIPLGVKLSAFSLKLNGYTLENIFQSSKVFERGGPYLDLLEVSPKEAKRDERLKKSGVLRNFQYEGHRWDLEPKTLFYDFIYCKAVKECLTNEELKNLEAYRYFTDVEFNPQKSINTQARAVVIVKLFMLIFGEIPELIPEDFLKFHRSVVRG